MNADILYSHVIWDWNGTLFDDVSWCVCVINTMLAKRGLKTLSSVEEYRNVFCFPVVRYYESLGFDFKDEAFEALAKEYIDLYHAGNTGNCRLYEQAEALLKAVSGKGMRQIILSASEQGNLDTQIDSYNIRGYFDEILGISNIFAKSKLDIGLDYLSRNSVSRALLVGDSAHDSEVAAALGADCVLIAKGHQSKNTLMACDVPVLDDISCFEDFLGFDAI